MFEQTISSAARYEIKRVGQFVAEHEGAWAIPRVSAEFLHTLVLAGGYRRGLEIGTSYGYSALWLGSAFQHNGGLLVTIDNNGTKVAQAREVFEHAGLGGSVRSLLGCAELVLTEVEGPFDFVFIDADKPSSRHYFDLVWPRLAERAVLVTDNVLSHEEQMAPFVAHLRQHSQLCSALVPIGSGLELTVKPGPTARAI